MAHDLLVSIFITLTNGPPDGHQDADIAPGSETVEAEGSYLEFIELTCGQTVEHDPLAFGGRITW